MRRHAHETQSNKTYVLVYIRVCVCVIENKKVKKKYIYIYNKILCEGKKVSTAAMGCARWERVKSDSVGTIGVSAVVDVEPNSRSLSLHLV